MPAVFRWHTSSVPGARSARARACRRGCRERAPSRGQPGAGRERRPGPQDRVERSYVGAGPDPQPSGQLCRSCRVRDRLRECCAPAGNLAPGPLAYGARPSSGSSGLPPSTSPPSGAVITPIDGFPARVGTTGGFEDAAEGDELGDDQLPHGDLLSVRVVLVREVPTVASPGPGAKGHAEHASPRRVPRALSAGAARPASGAGGHGRRAPGGPRAARLDVMIRVWTQIGRDAGVTLPARTSSRRWRPFRCWPTRPACG